MLHVKAHYETLTQLTRLAQRQEEALRWIEELFEDRLEQLAKAAFDVAVETGDPVGLALTNRLEKGISPELMLELLELCHRPEYRRCIPLREVALTVTLAARRFFERAAEVGGDVPAFTLAALSYNVSHWFRSVHRVKARFRRRPTQYSRPKRNRGPEA